MIGDRGRGGRRESLRCDPGQARGGGWLDSAAPVAILAVAGTVLAPHRGHHPVHLIAGRRRVRRRMARPAGRCRPGAGAVAGGQRRLDRRHVVAVVAVSAAAPRLAGPRGTGLARAGELVVALGGLLWIAVAAVRRQVAQGVAEQADLHPEFRHLSLDDAPADRRAPRTGPHRPGRLPGDDCFPNAPVEGGEVTGYLDVGKLAVADRGRGNRQWRRGARPGTSARDGKLASSPLRASPPTSSGSSSGASSTT